MKTYDGYKWLNMHKMSMELVKRLDLIDSFMDGMK